MTATLGELATLVRSKNAGPFWITIDVFLPDASACQQAIRSPVTDPAAIADLYAVQAGQAGQVRIFRLPGLHAIKISFPRPAVQGSLSDRDMHAGQQYVPVLDIPVAATKDHATAPRPPGTDTA